MQQTTRAQEYKYDFPWLWEHVELVSPTPSIAQSRRSSATLHKQKTSSTRSTWYFPKLGNPFTMLGRTILIRIRGPRRTRPPQTRDAHADSTAHENRLRRTVNWKRSENYLQITNLCTKADRPLPLKRPFEQVAQFISLIDEANQMPDIILWAHWKPTWPLPHDQNHAPTVHQKREPQRSPYKRLPIAIRDFDLTSVLTDDRSREGIENMEHFESSCCWT